MNQIHKMQKPTLTITVPLQQQNTRIAGNSSAPKLARFICFLFQTALMGQQLNPETLQLHLRQPVYLVMYIEKLLEITPSPLPTVMLALGYIQRIRESTPSLQESTPREQLTIFTIGIMLAQKCTDDHPYSNKVWCKVIGMDVAELTRGERDVLQTLQWSLHVPLEKYSMFCKQIQSLAKIWNQLIMKTSTGRLAIPASPQMNTSTTPMTPTSSIPVYLNRIDSRLQNIPSTVQSAVDAAPKAHLNTRKLSDINSRPVIARPPSIRPRIITNSSEYPRETPEVGPLVSSFSTPLSCNNAESAMDTVNEAFVSNPPISAKRKSPSKNKNAYSLEYHNPIQSTAGPKLDKETQSLIAMTKRIRFSDQ